VANSDSLRFRRVGRARQLRKRNRSDKTYRRSRDRPAHYNTAVTPISKRKAAASLKSETLHYPLSSVGHTVPLERAVILISLPLSWGEGVPQGGG
jgi:hypothetical protein